MQSNERWNQQRSSRGPGRRLALQKELMDIEDKDAWLDLTAKIRGISMDEENYKSGMEERKASKPSQEGMDVENTVTLSGAVVTQPKKVTEAHDLSRLDRLERRMNSFEEGLRMVDTTLANLMGPEQDGKETIQLG